MMFDMASAYVIHWYFRLKDFDISLSYYLLNIAYQVFTLWKNHIIGRAYKHLFIRYILGLSSHLFSFPIKYIFFPSLTFMTNTSLYHDRYFFFLLLSLFKKPVKLRGIHYLNDIEE